MLVPLPFAEVIRFRAELGEQVTGNLVMDAQKDLVKPLLQLEALICVKG